MQVASCISVMQHVSMHAIADGQSAISITVPQLLHNITSGRKAISVTPFLAFSTGVTTHGINKMPCIGEFRFDQMKGS